MSRSPNSVLRRLAFGGGLAALLLIPSLAPAQQAKPAAPAKAAPAAAAPAAPGEMFPGIGRAATPAELAAWDIDVRPDFKGLPKGSGSVEKGQDIWEARCASCHGTFGEANSVFSPLVGGTTAEDQKTGNVASLKRPDYPGRTTFMKVSSVSTLYDYIRRAMPWDKPKSLSNDDVYAVLAYLLNLAEIVPDDFVLDDKTIRDVQAKLPNRNGVSTQHGLWVGAGFGTEKLKPDTANTACMKDCATEVKVTSFLPEHARNNHGNLAQQMRLIGPVRGVQTGPEAADAKPVAAGPAQIAETAGCMACHGIDRKLVGPAYQDVAAKYKGSDVVATLTAKLKNGGGGVWGDIEMPPQEDLSDADAKTLITWILAGAPAH